MSDTSLEPIVPDWPAPSNVRALATTRAGGVSREGWASLNLARGGGDDPEHVAENRRRFRGLLPGEPGWMWQVHGDQVARREALETEGAPVKADAVWCRTPGLPCTVMTADCLPVLFCDRAGTQVAAAHAGWRGLAGGVIEATIEAMPAPPAGLMAWIGPGIGVNAYEVGPDFESEFRRRLPWLETGFVTIGGNVHADLEAIARAILARAGVESVHGGGFCTHTDADRFFSYRRNPISGRMATTVWLSR